MHVEVSNITGSFKSPPKIMMVFGIPEAVHVGGFIQDCRKTDDFPVSTPDVQPLKSMWPLWQTVTRCRWRQSEETAITEDFRDWRSGSLTMEQYLDKAKHRLEENIQRCPRLELRSEKAILKRLRVLGIMPCVAAAGAKYNYIDGERLTQTSYITKRVQQLHLKIIDFRNLGQKLGGVSREKKPVRSLFQMDQTGNGRSLAVRRR